MITLLTFWGLASPVAAEGYPCHIRGLADRLDCHTMALPLDWSQGEGTMIDVFVAIVPATTASPAADPVFVLAGGPGQAASSLGPQVAALFGEIRKDRALVLIDQRGVGRSTRIDCPVPDDEDALDDWRLAEACLDDLEHPPQHFLTDSFLKDIDAVRRRLGFEQISLWGGSYGSRAALLYARDYVEHVRALILDGVFPTDWRLFDGQAVAAKAAFDALMLACGEAAGACPEGGLEQAASGEWDSNAIGALRAALYDPFVASVLPYILQALADGNSAPLDALTHELGGSFGEAINPALYLTVICAEEVPLMRLEEKDSDNLFTGLVNTLKTENCVGWPVENRDPDYTDPVTVASPSLLLSGEFDPILPPAAGARAAGSLPNARHIVVPDAGHIVGGIACGPQLMRDFLRDLDPAALDETCFTDHRRPAFLLDAAGPTP